jgi:hypothetical protein
VLQGHAAGALQRLRGVIASPAFSLASRTTAVMDAAYLLRCEQACNSDQARGQTGVHVWTPVDMRPDRIVDEALQTVIVASRSPHAPFFGNLLLKSFMPTFGLTMFSRPDTAELHRWLKSIERGVVLFLERSLEGRRIDPGELRTVRDTILAAYPPSRRKAPPWHRRWLARPVMDRLQHEWASEQRNGAGLATRVLTGATVWQQTNDVDLAWRTLTTGDLVKKDKATNANTGALESYADQLIEHARTTPKKYPKAALPVRDGA